jgi:hypothetical protein
MQTAEPVYPTEVFAAIEEAKRRNPKDKFGDGAFRIDIANIRASKNGLTRYISFQILKKKPSGNWEYVPLNLSFMNLNTTARILPPGDAKKKYAGARLQYTMNRSTFKREGVEQKYGAAKEAIYDSFRRMISRLLQSGKLNNHNTKIASCIQTERVVDSLSQKKEKLEKGKEIIRVEIPFTKVTEGSVSSIAVTETPKCDIYDAEKKKKVLQKKDEFPLELAVNVDGSPLTYGNIHEFVTCGSACSGLDCMDSVCLSGQGISLPSKVTLLIVKHSKGFKPDPSAVFGMADLAEISIADTVEEEDDNSAEGSVNKMSKQLGALEIATENGTEEDFSDLTGGVNIDTFEVADEDAGIPEGDPEEEF